MQDIDEIRVLVGLNVDKRTIDIINQAEEETTLETLSHKEAKEAFGTVVEVYRSPHSCKGIYYAQKHGACTGYIWKCYYRFEQLL